MVCVEDGLDTLCHVEEYVETKNKKNIRGRCAQGWSAQGVCMCYATCHLHI